MVQIRGYFFIQKNIFYHNVEHLIPSFVTNMNIMLVLLLIEIIKLVNPNF